MPTLNELARHTACAIYNDLSHMNPRYLTPQRYPQTFRDEELLYHKRNLLLLSLYFDKIIICTDNISAFTKFMTKDVVSSVVMSRWFMDLVDQGIIVLAGWGSSISADLMKNQEDYSSLYRPELKEARYKDVLRDVSERAHWVVREAGSGESEHINFLMPHLLQLEGPFELKDVSFLVDLAEQTHASVGYVGTMELFPFIEELYGRDSERTDAFYRSYYVSWHEYCAAHYGPAVPIHTRRILLPRTYVKTDAFHFDLLVPLYSPDLFERYLVRRFGEPLLSKLLDVEVSDLVAIRNGDWAKFKTRYHEHLQAASRICWIAYHPHAHDLVERPEIVDKLISEIFQQGKFDKDLAALGNAIDLVLGLALGATGMASVFELLRKQINQRLGHVAQGKLRSEFEPYLRKLKRLLEGQPSLALIPSLR